MVRRGSTVRVRQRALQKRRKSALFVWRELARSPACGGYGALGLRWIERIVAESGNNCASTFTLPEWLHERRADLVTEDQIARWQRIVDLLVVAGDSRVADLAD
jgi:hypothetical protein